MEVLTRDLLREELERFAESAFQKQLANYSEALLSAVKTGLHEELPRILQDLSPRAHPPARRASALRNSSAPRGHLLTAPTSANFDPVGQEPDSHNHDWSKRHMRGYIAMNEKDDSEQLWWQKFKKEHSHKIRGKPKEDKSSDPPASHQKALRISAPTAELANGVSVRPASDEAPRTSAQKSKPMNLEVPGNTASARNSAHPPESAKNSRIDVADEVKMIEIIPCSIVPEPREESCTPLMRIETVEIEADKDQKEDHVEEITVLPFNEGPPPAFLRDVHTPKSHPTVLNGVEEIEDIKSTPVENFQTQSRPARVNDQRDNVDKLKEEKSMNDDVLKVVARAMRGPSVSTSSDAISSRTTAFEEQMSCMEMLRWAIHSTIHSACFDYVIGIIILANGICMGLQTDYIARHRPDAVPAGYRILDLLFCVVFVSELCLRVFADRSGFYYSPEWRWNCFDVMIVGMQLMEEVLMAIVNSLTDNDGALPLNFSFLRVLRILRLVKIVRLVRVLRLIGELRTLVMSIAGSMKSLGWTILLLFLIVYSLGVYLTQLVTDVARDNASNNLENFYGNLPFSVLTLFQSITGGLDWNDALQPLVNDVSPLMTFVFVAYIAFSVLAMLNVVTGVFVESALLSAKRDQDIYMVNNMRDFFKRVKAEAPASQGGLSCDDFVGRLDLPQMLDYFKAIDVDPSEASSVFRLIDLNNDGCVDIDEFVSGCTRLRGPAKALDLAVLIFEVRRMMEDVMEMRAEMNAGWLQPLDAVIEDSIAEASFAPSEADGDFKDLRSTMDMVQLMDARNTMEVDKVGTIDTSRFSSEDVESEAVKPSGKWFQNEAGLKAPGLV